MRGRILPPKGGIARNFQLLVILGSSQLFQDKLILYQNQTQNLDACLWVLTPTIDIFDGQNADIYRQH